jgi:hypothetical protein
MEAEPSLAKAHLQKALDAVGPLCEPLADATLTDWYVITVHRDQDGEEVLSRVSRPNQSPWTDMDNEQTTYT